MIDLSTDEKDPEMHKDFLNFGKIKMFLHISKAKITGGFMRMMKI